MVCLAVSGLAVLVIGLPVPTGLRHAAETFASPGEFLWWSTIGGAFSGRPIGALGYTVWVIGTAAFWFVVLAVLAAGTSAVAKLVRQRRAT